MSVALPSGRYTGWKPSPPDPRNYVTQIDEGVEVPKEYDPRGETPPIYDQAELGSCTANATMRAIRYAFMVAGADPGDLSRLWAYAQTRFLEGGRHQFDEDSGSYGHNDFKVARKQGLVLASVWDYSDYKASFNDWAKFQEAKHTPQDQRHWIGTYSHPHPDAATLKAVVSSKKIVPFGFNVYESFESEEVARTGIVPVPQRGERVLGGHEVAIEGYVYLNGKFYWLVPNNWSTNWGDKGYCYFPEECMFGYGASDWRVVDSVKS